MIRLLLLVLSAAASDCARDGAAAWATGAGRGEHAAGILSDAADAWVARGNPRPILLFAASSALARWRFPEKVLLDGMVTGWLLLMAFAARRID